MRNCPNCNSSEHTLYLTEGDFKIVKCSNCSLVYLLNIPDESEIYEDYYKIEFSKDDYSKDSKFPHLAEIYTINDQRLYYLKKLKLNGSLLDIGSGTGLFLKTARDYGYKVEGIDVSQNALAFAGESFNLNVSDEKIEDLIAQNKKYDFVTLWHVLEHFANPKEELTKIKKLLNPGGILLIEVPNLNSLKFKLAKNKWKGGNHPLYHRTFFTAETLKKTLELAGFNKTERLKISYELPGKSVLYNKSKDIFNMFAMDAFLDFAAFNN
jgi:2-polyprenyl-3-methyl-5-hydroxy-6-metoxy-1,4-benzoquinol methylase